MPDPAGTIQNPSYIEGSKFSYIENDQTKKIALDRQEISVTATSENVATSGETKTASPTTQPEPTPADVTKPAQEAPDPAALAPAQEPVAESPAAATSKASAPKNAAIHYSVQIGAFKNGVNVSVLGKKYAIKETIKTEMQDGYTKCVLGKYDEYKTARDNRETIKGKGVGDAFVTAYNSGRRITVQEALMVSNQKWYK